MNDLPLETDLSVRQTGPPPGTAPIMVFLHGLTGSGAGWPDAEEHWGAAYTILAVDQRGHGSSPRFTPEQLAGHPGDVMVDDAVALLEQLPVPPVLVGHSMGGAVALAAGVRRPDLVRALVLEDPAPLGPGEKQREPKRGEEFLAGLRESLAAPDDEQLLAVRRNTHPDWTEQELLASGHGEQQVDLDYLAVGDLRPSPLWPDMFAQIPVRTLVVSGDVPDEVCITADHERGLAEIGNPHVRLVRVPGAGHCIRREQPAAFYETVDDFLADVPD